MIGFEVSLGLAALADLASLAGLTGLTGRPGLAPWAAAGLPPLVKKTIAGMLLFRVPWKRCFFLSFFPLFFPIVLIFSSRTKKSRERVFLGS